MKTKGICFVLWAAALWAVNYLLLIPVNPTALSFWVEVLIFGTLLLYLLAIPVSRSDKVVRMDRRRGGRSGAVSFSLTGRWAAAGTLFAVCGTVLLLVCLAGCSPLFHAGNYAATLGDIETITFQEARPEVDSVSNIALIDTATAQRIGARELGSLEDVVSQFCDGSYTQITYNGRVKKVAVVDYDGLFKYMNNRENGTPGYLIVDPIAGGAQLVRMPEGIRYTPGAFFSRNIYRHIRRQYRTLLFGETFFEIDEDGAPYWVTQVQRHRVFLSNPQTVGIILTDAVTGHSERYALADIPEWVDTVFDGNYVCDKYDNYGMYSGGFWNSIFGKRGCRTSTKTVTVDEDGDAHSSSDFGYVADEKDIWIYTGVTSATSSDHSDIGMLMVNGRTGQARYMTLAGADESSAMAAANGELQQYGYHASFPSIINVDGAPAYIMVMTDDNYIVKNYAMVNMQNYSQVVTGSTQNEVFRRYRSLVGGGSDSGEVQQSTVSDVRIRTAVYGSDENGPYLELTFQDGSVVKYYMG